MNTLLEILFSLTVAGSLVTVCIHVLGWVSTDHFPASWRYRLTKMAVGLYLIPIALVFPWLSQLTASRMSTITQDSDPAKLAGALSEPFRPAVILSATVAFIILVLWAAGVIGFAAWQIHGYRKFIKELVRTRTIATENSETAILLRSIQRELGLKGNVGLAYSPIARSPFVAGLWKPSIYLPAEIGANLDMEMVIRHELIHLKRKDLWIKALTLGASALHWFNPLVHSVRKELHTWSELTCDQEVVRGMSHDERKRYGMTLLNVMAGSTSLPGQFYAPLSGDGKQLKRRLMHMLNAKKLKKKTIFVSVTAALFIAGISTSAAAWASKITPQVVAGAEDTATGASGSEISEIIPAPAQSYSLSAQEEPAAQPAPEVVAVPEEDAPAQAQEGASPQPAPELIAIPEKDAPAQAQEGAALQPAPEVVAVPAEGVSAQAQVAPAPQPVAELAAVTSARK